MCRCFDEEGRLIDRRGGDRLVRPVLPWADLAVHERLGAVRFVKEDAEHIANQTDAFMPAAAADGECAAHDERRRERAAEAV
jgi:hypothetical protein